MDWNGGWIIVKNSEPNICFIQPECEKSSIPLVEETNESCDENSGCPQECRMENGYPVSCIRY